MEQSFVNFCSPGFLFPEQTRMPVALWDVDAAVEIARNINERHGAKPFGFFFTTRGRDSDELDSKELSRSPFYYLGGRIETRSEIEARKDPSEALLLKNMRLAGVERVIVNDNSFRFTAELKPTDIVLDVTFS